MTKGPYALLAVVCGVGLVAQAGINARLGEILGHPLRAASASFLTGIFVLIPPAVASGAPLHTEAMPEIYRLLKHDKTELLMFCGGPLGAFFVASGVLLSPLIGFAMFFVAVVTGQLVMSLVYDKIGFYHTEKQSVGTLQSVGVVLAIGGAVIFQGDQLTNSKGVSAEFTIVGVVAGALLIIQSSFNKRLSKVLRSPWRGALISFIIGSLALLSAAAIETVVSNRSLSFHEVGQWWMWFGGPIGAAVLGLAFILVPGEIGFVLTFASVVLGELVGGLVLDHLDALGLGKRPATPLRVTGIITVLIAMGLVSFSSATRIGKKKNLNDAKDCDDSKDEDSDHKSKGAEKKRHHEEQQQQRHLHELKPANSIVMTCSSSNRPSAIMLRRCDVSGAP